MIQGLIKTAKIQVCPTFCPSAHNPFIRIVILGGRISTSTKQFSGPRLNIFMNAS